MANFSVLGIDDEKVVTIVSDQESAREMQEGGSLIVTNICQKYGAWAVKVVDNKGTQIGPVLATTTKDPRKNRTQKTEQQVD
jgi:hypothetical protein